MTTKDEALRLALDALKLGAAMYSPAGTYQQAAKEHHGEFARHK